MSSDMPDPNTPANDPGTAPVEEPEARIVQLESEVARYKDQALRALAEAENTRRRTQRELEDNSRYANTNLARDILPLADNLRRALDTLTPEERAADEKLEKFAQGIELVEREFIATIERHHVKKVDPLGQAFDHNLHQAVAQVETADKPAGIVVQVLQPGYTIHGRLLRPAMVVVSKGGPANTAGAGVDTTA
jgi:molecular chaperone GrpE